MSKKLILAVALSLVLFSGAMVSAQADCCFHWPNFCCLNWNPCNWCGSQQSPPPASHQDTDRPLNNQIPQDLRDY